MQRRDFLFTFTALALAGCASAPDGGAKPASGMVFSESERKIIGDFYAAQRRGPATNPPPQRAKPGDKLDSGLRPAKLPSDLLAKLPDLPDPYTRLTLGADVILVNRGTHDIVDVIPQVAY